MLAVTNTSMLWGSLSAAEGKGGPRHESCQPEDLGLFPKSGQFSDPQCVSYTSAGYGDWGSCYLYLLWLNLWQYMFFLKCHQTGIDVPINELKLVVTVSWGSLKPWRTIKKWTKCQLYCSLISLDPGIFFPAQTAVGSIQNQVCIPWDAQFHIWFCFEAGS